MESVSPRGILLPPLAKSSRSLLGQWCLEWPHCMEVGVGATDVSRKLAWRWIAQGAPHWTAAEAYSLVFSCCSAVQKQVFKIFKICTADSWTVWMSRVENPPIILQLTFCILHSASEDTTNCRSCSPVVSIYRRKSLCKRRWQFKPVLLKGHLSAGAACWVCPQLLHLCGALYCCEGLCVEYGDLFQQPLFSIVFYQRIIVIKSRYICELILLLFSSSWEYSSMVFLCNN